MRRSSTLFVDLGHVAAMRGLPDRGPRSTCRKRSIRSTSGSAIGACSSSCRPTSRPSGIFSEYAYFSSYSDSWVDARRAVRRGGDRARRRSGRTRGVVEIASNDGYLLQHVVARASRPSASSRPRNIAAGRRGPRASRRCNEFFSRGPREARSCETSGPADFVVANNVFAHVPDLNDFTAGLAALLAARRAALDRGRLPGPPDRATTSSTRSTTSTSCTTRCSAPRSVLARHGLRILDVEELRDPRRLDPACGSSTPTTHGRRADRSRRVQAEETSGRAATSRAATRDSRGRGRGDEAGPPRVPASTSDDNGSLDRGLWRAREGQHLAQLLRDPDGPARLPRRPESLQARPLHARARTSRSIPPERLAEVRPDVILIMPWNLRDEIAGQLAYTRAGGHASWWPSPGSRSWGSAARRAGRCSTGDLTYRTSRGPLSRSSGRSRSEDVRSSS